MMKKIYLFFFILFFFCFTSSVYGIDFAYSEPESLTFEGTFENWTEESGYQPSVILINATYHMFYTTSNNNYANQRIAYATSVDGTRWKRIKTYNFGYMLPVRNPNITKNLDTYILTFGVDTTPSKIMSVKSRDIGNFDASSLQEELHSSQSSDISAVTDPYRCQDNTSDFLWYAGLSNIGWHLHLAYQDNNTWQKCDNNPISSDMEISGPSYFKYDAISYIFYRSDQGISYIQTSSPLSCYSNWSYKNDIAGTASLFFPNVLRIQNKIYMYYTKIENGFRSFERAIIYTNSINTKRAIILIPGLFASWNKEAIIHEKQVNQNDWILNPMVSEYKGIEKTLENLGYVKNFDYFVFTYDWRKNIENIADDFNTFITEKNLTEFDIVGHSLGGLVGRIYAQKYNTLALGKLITVGSPHLGTAITYPIVEAGEIQKYNSYMWLAQELVFNLYRDGVKTNKQIVKEKFQVAQNMFPTTDFLKKKNAMIKVNAMQIQNNLLSSYTSVDLIKEKLITISGNKGNTVSGFNIIERSLLDKLLDRYPDGRPTSSLYLTGDYTVTQVSSNIIGTTPILPLDHGRLIWSKPGIDAILNSLDTIHEQADITEGAATNITPSLIFTIMSPASLTVVYGNKTYQEVEGLIFIPEAQSGIYNIKATGNENGVYSILIGQLGKNKTTWQRVEGEITHTGQVDNYQIDFNNIVPKEQSIGGINELVLTLNSLNKTLNNRYIIKAVDNLKQITNSKLPRIQLLTVLNSIFKVVDRKISPELLAVLLNAVEKLELIYVLKVKTIDCKFYPHTMRKALEEEKHKFNLIQIKLEKKQNKTQTIQLITAIEDKFIKADTAHQEKNYKYLEILLISINNLLLTIRN